jgi:hypothetical protein
MNKVLNYDLIDYLKTMIKKDMTENNFINEKYPLSDLTGKIIKCAIEVHKHLGNGFQEVVYQRALAIEFDIQGVSFEREFEIPLFYKGERIGTRRVDFFCRGNSDG